MQKYLCLCTAIWIGGVCKWGIKKNYITGNIRQITLSVKLFLSTRINKIKQSPVLLHINEVTSASAMSVCRALYPWQWKIQGDYGKHCVGLCKLFYGIIHSDYKELLAFIQFTSLLNNYMQINLTCFVAGLWKCQWKGRAWG